MPGAHWNAKVNITLDGKYRPAVVPNGQHQAASKNLDLIRPNRRLQAPIIQTDLRGAAPFFRQCKQSVICSTGY
ncbi:MAG: hypothetical protein DMG97_05910 [Acidobacteria bacterium]|nr:MAG: hypothetical protein DMG98_12115 [Acidobacteriota bacterium]PYV75668.1 MAG: hypothetical protein DMG97_05910 [Acidobacteriota bacterium]PYV78665.1 MAG: hypothetical protein DMG96_06910 [Acidobacteriota bacterium]